MSMQASSRPRRGPPTFRSTLAGKSAANDVLNSWKAAHAAFASAVDTYIGASSDLESFCKLASEDHEGEDLEDICNALEDRIPVLILHEEKLRLARASLQRQRNTSRKLSSVGRLPLEVLTSIFVIAVTSDRTARTMSHPKPHSVDFANILASVCSYWRRVAISIPELWSYIDLSRHGGLDHVSLWLERARNRALDIRTGSETTYPDWRHQHTPFVQNANRARSLFLRGGRDYMNLWLSRWYQDGVPRTTTTLALHPVLQDDDILDFPGANMPSQTMLDELLRPISVLYLRHVVVAWGQVSFQNLSILCLVELEEVGVESAINIDILCKMLLASPRLQCLQLVGAYISHTESIREITPSIRLEYLETLELSGLAEAEILLLLSNITPGSRPLAFLISREDKYPGFNNLIEGALVRFLQRSNVTTFYCGANTVEYLSPEIVYALPNIEVLFLADKMIGSIFSNSVAPEAVPSDSVQTCWPKLHSFQAANCEFEDIIDFKRLLAVCPIQELRIDAACSTGVLVGDRRDHGSMEFANWAGPGVVFSYDCRKWEIGYMPFR
ncbi:hypothetical protein BDV93DRAFT_528180 [Ceratobasidium sp. AG-I]|nr:hypothetical protein BDV93DRAFT_528180 [Ceratobasidium sp. AG-I]